MRLAWWLDTIAFFSWHFDGTLPNIGHPHGWPRTKGLTYFQHSRPHFYLKHAMCYVFRDSTSQTFTEILADQREKVVLCQCFDCFEWRLDIVLATFNQRCPAKTKIPPLALWIVVAVKAEVLEDLLHEDLALWKWLARAPCAARTFESKMIRFLLALNLAQLNLCRNPKGL